jgi:hypothetical protein
VFRPSHTDFLCIAVFTHTVRQVWHIRSEFSRYLMMDNFESEGTKAEGFTKGDEKDKSSKATPKRKRDDEKATGSSGAVSGPDSSEPKKYKRAFGFFVKDKRKEAEVAVADPAVSRACCAYS